MEESTIKGSQKRIAVVTGANKGVGLEICRQLAVASDDSIMVICTARDEWRGTEALEKLKSSGASDVLFHQLDVTDSSSVASLANFINTQFGKLDILVNNAGIAGTEIDPQDLLSCMEEEDGLARFVKIMELARATYEKVEECLKVNYYGLKRVTEALIPLLKLSQSPRIVNVSSRYGQLRYIPGDVIRKEMGAIDDQTDERLDELLKSFQNDFKEGKLEANGWPTSASAYTVSKVAVNTYTRILAKIYPTFCINCVTPGFVKTDINYNTGNFTVEEGAKGPVMLALLPDGSSSGLFYQQMDPSTFE